jgi:hypothetical protein
MPRLVGMRSADMRRAEMPPPTAATHATNRPPTTPPGLRGRNSWRGWGRSFLLRARGVVATSDSLRSLPIRGRSGRSWHISANRSNHRPSRRPAGGPPTGASLCRATFDRAIFQATDRRAARHRYPQPLTAFHATVRTARMKSGFKAGSSRRKNPALSVERKLFGTSTIGPHPADRSRRLLLMIRPARPTLAEVPLADLSLSFAPVPDELRRPRGSRGRGSSRRIRRSCSP